MVGNSYINTNNTVRTYMYITLWSHTVLNAFLVIVLIDLNDSGESNMNIIIQSICIHMTEMTVYSFCFVFDHPALGCGIIYYFVSFNRSFLDMFSYHLLKIL